MPRVQSLPLRRQGACPAYSATSAFGRLHSPCPPRATPHFPLPPPSPTMAPCPPTRATPLTLSLSKGRRSCAGQSLPLRRQAHLAPHPLALSLSKGHDRRTRPLFANRIPCLESPLSATDSKSQSNPRPYLRRHSFSCQPLGKLAPAASTAGVGATLVVARPQSGGIGAASPASAACFTPLSFRPPPYLQTPRRLSPPCFAPHSSPICGRRLKPRNGDTIPSWPPSQMVTRTRRIQAAPSPAARQPAFNLKATPGVSESGRGLPRHGGAEKKTRDTNRIESNTRR